jgi:hypothetical protein
MKSAITSTPPEQSLSDLAHLAWCGLIALKLARQDGLATSPLMTHTFLNRWLATAQKQKRFPKTVALDITSLLDLARRKGPAAKLDKRLDYLWLSCSEPLQEQSDLFRLTYVIEQLRAQTWLNAVVSDSEWNTSTLLGEYQGENALLVRKSQLQAQFSSEGALTGEINFLVNGDKDEVRDLFRQHNLHLALSDHTDSWHEALLAPAMKKAD